MAATAAGLTVRDMVFDYFSGAVLKAMLVGAGWTFDKHTHEFRSAITGEVTGQGYTAGGTTITGVAVQLDTVNSRVEIVGDDVNYGTLTVSGISQIVVYIDTGNAATDRIVGVHTFPAESPAGENFTYAWFDDDSVTGTKGVIGHFTY